ncbi:LysR family transcriptional regulator [Amphritea sp.]|uniref:LysR family transcriptional regulator n=1 Tax=Amphritea sp. TaxID=1872502 RepID=UPI003A949C9B
MNPKHLSYLATIIDKGSITAASDALRVAQPTLTRAMATLEMQAGTPLLLRSRYGVKSTPFGEVLAREGRSIIQSLQLAQEQVAHQKLGVKSEFRIATGPLLGLGVMPDILERLTQAHPTSACTVTCGSPAITLPQMSEGRFDIMLAPTTDDRFIQGVQRRLVMEDHIGIFCDKSHPLAQKKIVKIEDLEASDWLSLGLTTTFENQVLELLMTAGLKEIRTKIAFGNDAAILATMLSRGRYLAVLPRIPMAALPASLGDFVELELDLTIKVKRYLYLWVREDVLDSPIFLTFEEAMADFVSMIEAKSA